MSTSYDTLLAPCQGQLREKASRFLAFCYPVRTVEEAEAILARLRKEHFDATHVCSAWRIGVGGEQWRANDDGEPAHSAGDPILAELRSRNLSYVMAAVVRHYGGTKLGVGGLIAAYREATSIALDAGQITTVHPTAEVRVTFPYTRTADVNRVIHQFSLRVSATEFAEESMLALEVRLSDLPAVKARLEELGLVFEVLG